MKAVIFDLDGTLIDSIRAWEKVSDRFLREYDIPGAPPIGVLIQQMNILSVADYYIEHYGVHAARGDLIGYWNNTLIAIHREGVTLKPYAKELLDALSSRGIPMCLATETEREIVEVALENAGIDPYFSFIITASDAGIGKTAPDIFLQAAARLGHPPGETVVFEDSLYSVETARQAGFLTCAVYEPYYEEQQPALRKAADYYVKDLGELTALPASGKEPLLWTL